MLHAMKRLAIALLLIGCTQNQLHTVRASGPELRALTEARTAWANHGRALTDTERAQHCAHMEPERIRIFYGSQAEVTETCRRSPDDVVIGCSWVGRETIGRPTETWLAVSTHGDSPVSPRTQTSLLIHEWSHVFRGCWFAAGSPDERYDRYHAGETEECRVRGNATDPYHCDRELWFEITREALRAWSDQ
jgi:hypothetical protein